MQLSKLLIFLLVIGCLSVSAAPSAIAHQSSPKSVHKLALSGDQRVLAAIYNSYEHRSLVDFFDSSTGELIHTVDLSPLVPGRIALSPTGDRLFFATSAGDKIGITDVEKHITVILYEMSAVSTDLIGWNPAKDEIAFTLGGGIHIWNAATGTYFYNISGGPGSVLDLDWSWDGNRLATSNYAENPFIPNDIKRGVKIWSLLTAQAGEILTVPSLTIENRGGGSLAWSPDGKRLAMIEPQRLVIYDVELEQVEVERPVESASFTQVAWDRSGNFLATGGSIIRVWDTDTWEVLHTFETEETTTSLQWSFSGQYIFSDGGSDGLRRDEMPIAQLEAMSVTRP